MFSHPRLPSVVLLVCVGLFTNTALGQSLSILRNGKNEIKIEANSPASIPYRLQASVDLQEWVDIKNEVSGPLSYQVDNARVTNRFFRLKTSATDDTPITLVMIGDSTVADLKVNNNWFSGWGEGMYGYFKPNVRVVNLAQAYHSTKVFLASAEMHRMRVIKPDFVLVHIGRVDASDWLGDPYKTTIAEYAANLKTIVQAIRDFNGTPILMTPVVPRIFDGMGKVLPSMEDRCVVVKAVASENRTYFIDLNQLSRNLFNELGESGSAYISWSQNDPVHFSLEGAKVIAGLVVKALPSTLRTYVVENANQPPAL